jgi:flagellar M-ring protein FliF
VPYRYADGGSSIEVPADQVYDTRMKLVSAGVPSGGHVGFELFNEADFGVTEFAQRVNYQRAIQGELERSIAALPGVKAVRVHLTIRRPGLFVGQDDASKASITVSMNPGQALTPPQVGGIRNLVASAVEGLAPSSVVVLGPSGVLQGGASASSAEDGVMAQNEEQSGYEARVRDRVSDMLSQVFNLQSYRVSVDARMNFDKVHKVSERLLSQGQDGNGLVVRKRISRTGVAGVDATAPGSQTQDEFDYAHGKEREEISRASGKVERLSVAVLVPPTLSPSEMERLHKLVAVAAGLDMQRGDLLEISAVTSIPRSENTVTNDSLIDVNGAADNELAISTTANTKKSGFSSAWLIIIAAAFLLIGWILASVLKPSPKKLAQEERDAVLLKLRSWLAEGGTTA